MATIKIIPSVNQYTDKGEKVLFKKLSLENNLSEFHLEILSSFIDKKSKYSLSLKKDNSLLEGAYLINVYQDYIECFYSNNEGKHNSICTLRQLLLNINELTTCCIYDEPLFKVRSVMIDVSRNKIPTLNTLKFFAYHLSLLKINDIQLYIEGRSFYYSFLDEFYENKNDFLLPEEIIEFGEYCKKVNITLTPNTNCFGHMTYWLNQEKFRHLAFNKDGFVFTENGTPQYAQTIDPNNDEAYDFAIKLFDELLKCFPNCNRITIGGDEPFELLFPVKHPNAKEIYFNHITRIIGYLHNRGITPCMWGDVAKIYPDSLKDLNDTILLEWGYEKGHINNENCSIYKNLNVPFMVCPGTSGWLTFSGRMENMIGNYNDAVINGINNGAIGIVITDWNDGGGLSQVSTNILTYAYGACYAWCGDNTLTSDLHNYLNKEIYKSPLADAVYDLGNYYLCQDTFVCNMTKLFISFFSCQTDGISMDIKNYSDCATLLSSKEVLNHKEIAKTEKYLSDWALKYDFINNNNDYEKEIKFIYKMICHSLKLNSVYLKLQNITKCTDDIEFLLKDIDELILEYNNLWHLRNKEADYRLSIKKFEILKFKYEYLLKLLSL